jgi:hypothetical protein
VILNIEKIIQHIFVTIAFWLDFGGLRSRVAVPPDLLIVAGAIVAILFMVSLWGMLTNKRWAISLLMGLALFDIFGEFVAQGRFDIRIPLSFIVAVLIFLLTIVFKRQDHRASI